MVLPTGIDTAAVAFEKWLQCEQQCYLANQRLRRLEITLEYPLAEDQKNDPLGLREELILRSRKKVAWLLGKCPDLNKVEWRMGKHATYAHKGERCLLPDKFCVHPEATSTALYSLTNYGLTAWARAKAGMLFQQGPISPLTFPDLVKGNRWSTVPKDGTTDRSIGVEPTLNLYYQLGVGAVIKSRLQRFGLLTKTMKEKHMRLAQKASRDNLLSTLDLSSASDTVSTSVVRLLLPEDWYDLLVAGRSPCTKVGSKWYRLEKFSSMGNGYTFELETLIFTSIALAVCEIYGDPLETYLGEHVSCVGDDIIVPTAVASQVATALRFFGFTLNASKSFSGITPFRESCGGDYYSGIDVRPVHFEQDPCTPLEWITLYNKVVRISENIAGLAKTLNYIRGLVPSNVRSCLGPRSLGDAVFNTENRSAWHLRLKEGLLELMVCVPTASYIPLARWDEQTAVVSLLYGCSSEGVQPRGEPAGYRVSWISAFRI
jgi:hypothetical protein